VAVRHGGLAAGVPQCALGADVAAVVVVPHGGLAAGVPQCALGADVAAVVVALCVLVDATAAAVVVVAFCVLVDATAAATGQGRKLPLSLPFEPLPWLSSQFPCPPPLCTHGSPP
jgi:hypothetical protein